MNFHVREFRLFPISSWRCPTEEYAKMCILNGIENHIAYCELGDDRSYWELYRDTLFLFQYGGQIIAKAKAHIKDETCGSEYYTDEISVLDEPITAIEIKGIWENFKKFNSSPQRVPNEYWDKIIELFDSKRKIKETRLGENESFCLDATEGKRILYYLARYERNPKYREQAIKIHGLTCQVCGFNFERQYGSLGYGYIEVHHKKPLYSLDEEVVPDPVKDMICVCSNCHRMLHRNRWNVISPEELIEILQRNGKK